MKKKYRIKIKIKKIKKIMTNRLKHNLTTIFVYGLSVYIILLPLKLWIIGISISIIIGFLFGILNDIVTQLRMLNGEKFSKLEEIDKEKEIKMIKS